MGSAGGPCTAPGGKEGLSPRVSAIQWKSSDEPALIASRARRHADTEHFVVALFTRLIPAAVSPCISAVAEPSQFPRSVSFIYEGADYLPATDWAVAPWTEETPCRTSQFLAARCPRPNSVSGVLSGRLQPDLLCLETRLLVNIAC